MRLADLDRAVREATGRGLAELLAELGGPLRDRPAERSALAGARDAAIRAAQASPLHDSCGWYRDWLAEIAAGRQPDEADQARASRRGSGRRFACWSTWPREAGGPVLLPALAADVTGDTKALNHGHPAVDAGAARARRSRPGWSGPRTARERRDLWEASGVVVDDLASRVLVLNLSAEGRRAGRVAHRRGRGSAFRSTSPCTSS